MPPEYMYPCPAGYYLPLTPWVTIDRGVAYALWVEAALLAMELLRFRMWRSASRGSVLSVFIVFGGALIASVAAVWTGYRNSQLCFYTSAHYTPELGAEWTRANTGAIIQANIILGLASVVFLIRNGSDSENARPALAWQAPHERGACLLTCHDKTT